MIKYRYLIEDYFHALSNEIAIDDLAYVMLRKDPLIENYFPRPAKAFLHISRIPFFMRKILVFFWRYILGYLFFTCQFFKSILRKGRNQSVEIEENKNLAIAFSDRAMDVITKENINKAIDFWIVFDWIDSFKIEKKHKINVFSLVSFSDIIIALKLSFHVHKKMSCTYEYSKWILQSYTAFRWFVVRIGLEKLSGNIFIAEHFDRWAVMVDCLSNHKRKQTVEIFKYSLVQHGVVKDISDNMKLKLPYRLGYTNELFVYDVDSERNFRENVLSLSIDEFLQNVYYFVSKLDLTEINCEESTTILVIGNPICEQLHRFVIIRLLELSNLKIYYKPHPLTPCSSIITDLNVEVIDNKNFYPKVDIVVTYPSTLELEYRNLGIKTFEHGINMEKENSLAFLSQLLSYLQQNTN